VARLVVTPAQIAGRHDERRLVSQKLTQLVQLPAQISQRLCACRIRPEQPRDTAASHPISSQLVRVIAELSDAAGIFLVRTVYHETRGWQWVSEPL
jgi:hypothetical protein